MSENRDGKVDAYRSVGWRLEIAAIAGPVLPEDTRESWLARAARSAAMPYRHVRALFYGEMTDPKYSVAYKVLIAAQKARISAAKMDARALSTKFETIAAGMLNADQDIYREDASALLNAARILRGLDRA